MSVVFVGRLSLGPMGPAKMGEKSERSMGERRPNVECIFNKITIFAENEEDCGPFFLAIVTPEHSGPVHTVCHIYTTGAGDLHLTTRWCGMKDSSGRDSVSQQAV